MQKVIFILLGTLVLTTLLYTVVPKPRTLPTDTSAVNALTNTVVDTNTTTNTVLTTNTNGTTEKPETNVNQATNTNVAAAPDAPSMIMAPMSDFTSRVTRKPFGIHITPSTSPIQPEKFSGYHTGADAEVTTAEANVDIAVQSVAAGTVVFAGHVNGYGGVIVIRHTINEVPLLSLYGHLRMSSFKVTSGSTVKQGQRLAMLGTGFSAETDGERKHLHFGLIKGTTVNYRGYVETKGELDAWEDPVAWLQDRGL